MKISWSSLIYRYYLPVLFLLLLPVMRNRVEPNLRGVIWSDAEGYYVYLPGVFNLKNVHAIPPGSMAEIKNDRGEMVLKYTCGVALFQMPFFLVAKVYCDSQGYAADDIYNRHYARAVAFAGYTVGFLGLFFLQRALRRRGFSEATNLLTILSVFGGTNLFHYMTKEMGMSHAYSFCLFAFLAWYLPRFYDRPDWKNAAILGGALGWIVLIRPTNVLALLFVLLYDVYTRTDLRDRMLFYWRHRKAVLVAAVAGITFWLPQMWYWQEMTGKWFRYSYTGERFIFWNKPKILDVLFDVQNGLFLYSPLVLLAVVGIGASWRARQNHAPALALIFVLATYLFASWWAWWFGGAFGHRSYVELYAILAFPLAGMLEKLLALKSSVMRYTGVLVVLFLIFYSVQLSFLYNRIGGPWDGADWRWNWSKMEWILSHLFDF